MRNIGFVYDPVGDRYLAWNGGNTIYVLNPVTWVWSTLATTGINPGSPNQRGSYGRFQYSPRLKGIALVNNTNENVKFLRL